MSMITTKDATTYYYKDRPHGSQLSRTPMGGHRAADMNTDRSVDPAMAHEVAAAYLDAPSRRDPRTDAAYAQLAIESDTVFRQITSPDRNDAVRVVFSGCPTPYRDAEELIAAVTNDRTLEVTIPATGRRRRHPLMDRAPGGAYDRFPA